MLCSIQWGGDDRGVAMRGWGGKAFVDLGVRYIQKVNKSFVLVTLLQVVKM